MAATKVDPQSITSAVKVIREVEEFSMAIFDHVSGLKLKDGSNLEKYVKQLKIATPSSLVGAKVVWRVHDHADSNNCFVSKICGRVLAREACQGRDTRRVQ